VTYLRQNSFAGGEIAPELMGRSDVAKYHTAVSTCRNMIPLRNGPVTSRPGTKYVATAAAATARILPFVWADGDAYILLFTDKSLSIYKEGVLQIVDGAAATALTTVFEDSELSRLKYAQLGNVLTICHPNHPPYDLERVNSTTWTITALSFDASAFSSFSLGAVPAMMPRPTFRRSGFYDITHLDNADYYSTDATHTAKAWSWGVTAMVQRADGIVFETTISPITKISHVRLPAQQGSAPATLSASQVASGTLPAGSYSYGVRAVFLSGGVYNYGPMKTGLTITSDGTQDFDVSWAGVAGAHHFEVWRANPSAEMYYLADFTGVFTFRDSPAYTPDASHEVVGNWKEEFHSYDLGGVRNLYDVGDVVTLDRFSGSYFVALKTQVDDASDYDPTARTQEFADHGVYWWSERKSTDNLVLVDMPEYQALGEDIPIRFVCPTSTSSSDYKVLFWRFYRCRTAGSGGISGDTVPVANQQWGWIGDSPAVGVNPGPWSALVDYKTGDFVYYDAAAGTEEVFDGVWVAYEDLFVDTAYTGDATGPTSTEVDPPGNVGPTQTHTEWIACPYYPLQMFLDVGQVPDYTVVPPLGVNPFKVYDLAGTLVTTENPCVVAYYEQRRVFANTYDATTGGRPGWIFGSKVGDYSNFDNAVIQTSDQEYEFELASMRYEEIRSLLPTARLLAFTNGSEWSIGGSQGAGLAYDNVDAKPQGNHGASWLDALQIGNEALFVQERGPHVQSVLFDFGSQSWDSSELNAYADHLLDGHTVVAWAWAHQPFHCVWMVREDGVLLSMTYQKEQEVNAWARHDMTDGDVLDICTVPEGAEDAVYLLVRRSAGYDYTVLERLSSLDPAGDVTSVPLLDCCTTTTYPTEAIRVVEVDDLHSHMIQNGDPVRLIATEDTWDAVEGPGTIGGANVQVVGTRQLKGGETVPTTFAFQSTSRVSAKEMVGIISGLTTTMTSGEQILAGQWGRTQTQVAPTSVFHLLGTVMVFNADGSYSETEDISLTSAQRTVTGTGIVAAWVGTPYTQQLAQLPPAPSGAEVRTRFGSLTRMSLEAVAYGTIQVGQDFDHLQTLTLPYAADPLGLNSDLIEGRVGNKWVKGALGVVQQTHPLPVTIISSIREVEFEES
jgi:hypothetical protein